MKLDTCEKVGVDNVLNDVLQVRAIVKGRICFVMKYLDIYTCILPTYPFFMRLATYSASLIELVQRRSLRRHCTGLRRSSGGSSGSLRGSTLRHAKMEILRIASAIRAMM